MKLTSTGSYVGAKLGVSADLYFFVSYVQKYALFYAKQLPSISDQPSKPCPMASKSSDDGHKSHPTPSLMPPLASVADEAVNFVEDSSKQPPQ
jgi:hypothetical protein